MSTYEDIVNNHEDRLEELETNSAKKVYSATNYAISELGINAQSTLLDLVQALPSISIAIYWINDNSEIGKTVRSAMAEFGWTSNVFGDLILDKTGATTYITFNCYNQPRRAYCSHSTINNVGFSSWSYSEDYLHLSGGAVNGSLIVNNGTASTVGGYYVTDKDGNTRGAVQMNSDNKYIFGGGGVSNTVQVGSSNTTQTDLYGTTINIKGTTANFSGSIHPTSNVVLPNNISLRGKKTNGTAVPLIFMSNSDKIYIGNDADSPDVYIPHSLTVENSTTIKSSLTTSGNITAGSTSTSAAISIYNSSAQANLYLYGHGTSYYARLRSPSTKMTANQNYTLPASGGTIAIASSDIRLKENIAKASNNALDIISKLSIHSFDWTTDGHHNEYGIIADEAQKILPTLVHQDGEGTEEDPSYKYIDILEYCSLLAKAVQELSAEVEKLKKE